MRTLAGVRAGGVRPAIADTQRKAGIFAIDSSGAARCCVFSVEVCHDPVQRGNPRPDGPPG